MAQFPNTTNADGIWTLKKVRRARLGNNWPVYGYASPTEIYNAGLPNGTYQMSFSSYQTTVPIDVNYASYDGRGWIEVLFSTDNAISTPWDHWLVNSGGGPTNSTDFGSEWGLQNFGQTNNSIAGYTGDSGVILLGNAFNATDFAITSKSAKTVIDVNATGQNQASALPLTSADLDGTQAALTKQAFIDYFLGLRAGFHSGNDGGADFDAGFTKAGLGPFEIVLASRDGNPSTEEWHIADGTDTGGSTFYSNVGYRDRASYPGNHVGSWTDNTSNKSGAYDIDSGNVLSIWLTDG